MTYQIGTQADAEQIAETLTTKRKGLPSASGSDRTITRYIADRYPGTLTYGVVERWTYNDRSDIGELGGGFVWNARDLARRG